MAAIYIDVKSLGQSSVSLSRTSLQPLSLFSRPLILLFVNPFNFLIAIENSRSPRTRSIKVTRLRSRLGHEDQIDGHGSERDSEGDSLGRRQGSVGSSS
ncbi:hypothetical protein RchiOBHm_Chr2g0088641 [Rosa chinensis]|uniref:Uncharacterized protein n=1 Tax=Rosa chinensis TaxID=74649 RepID=A0A2P6RIZ4_ROSCH|nr:hypothetical protein RchiOBHm_Chr2g0088641 [Rosa chinensis]